MKNLTEYFEQEIGFEGIVLDTNFSPKIGKSTCRDSKIRDFEKALNM